jgi:Predicted transcriptional regulators
MLPVSAIGLRMVAAANLVEVAALVGDTARATMLNALMGGQSLTATELAYCANVSRSTASGHLSKLVVRAAFDCHFATPLQLLSDRVTAGCDNTGEPQGRRRHRGTAPPSATVSKRRCTPFCPKLLRSPGWPGRSRGDRCTCAMGHIVLTDEGGEVTSSGERFLSAFGADLRPRIGGFSASLVSTGASVVITSRDSSELGYWIVYWSSDGSNACRAAVHSN